MDLLPFLALVAVAVVETVLSLTWNRIYLQTGIPIFGRTRRVSTPSEVPGAEVLQQHIPQSPYPTLVFRDLGRDTYAFREKAFEAHKTSYSALMRGVVTFDTNRRQLSVTGYLNWFSLAFVVVVAALLATWAPASPTVLLFILPLLGLGGWIYTVQRRRFVEVAETAATLWGQPRERATSE